VCNDFRSALRVFSLNVVAFLARVSEDNQLESGLRPKDAVDDLGDMVAGDFAVRVTNEGVTSERMVVGDRWMVRSNVYIVVLDYQQSLGFPQNTAPLGLDDEALRSGC